MKKSKYCAQGFKIGEKIVEKQYLGCYVVEVETMYGDADGYGKIKVGGFKRGRDESLLVELLDVCDKLKDAERGEKGEGYNYVEGFEKWFDSEKIELSVWNSMEEHEKDLCLNEWDFESDGSDFQASYEGFKVYYYDEEGFKYNVSIE